MRKLAILLLMLLCGGTACSRIPPIARAQGAEASSSGPYYKYLIVVPDDESWIGALARALHPTNQPTDSDVVEKLLVDPT